MSAGRLLIILLLMTLAAWVGWVAVLVQVNPETAGILSLASFYVALFLALFGTMSIIGFGWRSLLRRRTEQYRWSTSMRQAGLWSTAMVAALGLQSQRLLNIWMLIVLMLIFAVVEFLIISFEQRHREI